MKVIFIDRNIVAMMKHYNNTNEVLSGYSRSYAQIRKYDRRHNLVSLLLSSTEGTKQGLQTLTQMQATIEEDSKILEKFLREARNDGVILGNIVVDNEATFAETSLPKYMSYISWAAPNIKHTLKPGEVTETSRLPSFFVQLALAPIRADSLPDMGIGG